MFSDLFDVIDSPANSVPPDLTDDDDPCYYEFISILRVLQSSDNDLPRGEVGHT
jgi:hypothetical protein